jgi:tRNA threonylcarbamoyl adenosine modification protein YjeE
VSILALPDLAATRAFAAALAPRLRPGDVLLLDGPLGAGKTTLVRALVEALGGDGAQVSSPTFTLLHQYDCQPPMIHLDAYRLAGPGDLAALGFDELAEGAIAAVEWAQRVEGAFAGLRCWRLALDHDGEGRQITWEEAP